MTIGDGQAAGLVRLARSTLAARAGEEADRRRRNGESEMLVNVTVYVRQQLRASMAGRGGILDDAVRDAAARAAADVRFGPPLVAEDLADARVELWIRTASEVIGSGDLRRDVDLGFHGVEISAGDRSAYYKPSVPLTRGLTRHDLLFEKLTKKAGLPPGAWRDARTVLRRTEWEHYCEAPAGPDHVLRLRRLRPVDPAELTSATLRERAGLAASRLATVQSGDGYYLYKFHPFVNREVPGPGNLVRQAGCAYALSRAADRAADEQSRGILTSSATRTMDALLSRITVDAGRLFIAEPPKADSPVWGKLGTLALSLATLQSPALASRYEPDRQRLVEAILSWQRPDGSFRCRTDSASVADDAIGQDYYPGQALTVLAVEARAGAPASRRAIAAAFPWYRARFRAQPATAFVSWQVEAWSRYAQWAMSAGGPVAPDARQCSDFVFEMADWLLQFQIRPAALHHDLTGGYAAQDRKPGLSTATYTEAMIRAFSLAQRLAEVERAARYRQASLLGLDFVRRLQIMPDTGHIFRDPVRTVGGTTASLSDMTIRCDYDQHALTAYLAALETSDLLDS